MESAAPFNFARFIAQGDVVIVSVVAVLLLLSVTTWYLILIKWLRGFGGRRNSAAFLQLFWNAPSADGLRKKLEEQHNADPFSRIAFDAINASSQYRRHASRESADEAPDYSEFVTRAIRQGIAHEATLIESGLTLLASTGSTAPFIGLFGTVWGIYHALVNIGVSGRATLDSVAGPVGEALIVTAAGLAVAVPAVLAYNFFVRRNRLLLAQLESFAHELHAFLTLGIRLDPSSRKLQQNYRQTELATEPV